MKNISDLTEKELQHEILDIFNNNSWVIRPKDFDKLTYEQKQLYERYENLQLTLAEKYRRKSFTEYISSNKEPFKNDNKR